jgi:thiamine pyrophosphate-dependent acetolactate synthase large subunit-like protein
MILTGVVPYDFLLRLVPPLSQAPIDVGGLPPSRKPIIMTTTKRSPARAKDRPAQAANPTASLERPTPSGANAPGFGSDVAAEALRALDIPYIALNPGASYRGFHDSIVNYLGNEKPQMLLCLHEEAAVAIAHGWAKVTGKAMAAAVHSNVGLFHATMAMFNAWCDRMPVIVMGATGPVDAAARRPWIDWIHTAADQGAIVRNFTKWDDQPASAAASRESILRAGWIANTLPCGPVYVNLDAGMQESKLSAPLPEIDTARFVPPAPSTAPADYIRKAAEMLKGAKHPMIFAGRGSRSVEHWNNRVALAEAINAKVITDLKLGAVFPTEHPLYAGAPRTMSPDTLEAMRTADLILSLDWVDLAGALKTAGPKVSVKTIHASLDHHLHNGWSMDYEALPPVDLFLAGDPDIIVAELLVALGVSGKPKPAAPAKSAKVASLAEGTLRNEHLARALRQALGDRPTTLTHIPLSWDDDWWPFRHPLDYIGGDGGGGVGGGPGISVGAALALRDTDRIAVAICGDGDFMMGCTAVWTAAHYRIPLLIVVANNRSFFNDELHQERVARMRNRPVENRWIGQRISDPDIDIATVARGQGAVGFGPVTKTADLASTFEEAIAAVDNGHIVVVDVRVEPGYTAGMTSMMMRKTE